MSDDEANEVTDASGGRENELLARGRAVQAQLWPQVASGPTGAFPAARLAPDFYRYVAESAFGMIWSRPGLAIRDRSR